MSSKSTISGWADAGAATAWTQRIEALLRAAHDRGSAWGSVDPPPALADVDPDVILRELREWLAHLDPARRNSLVMLSRATPTHTKWALHEAALGAPRIWIHEYRAPSDKPVFVEFPHDHRYGFQSKLLTGRITHSLYERSGNSISSHAVAEQTLEPGDVMHLSSTSVHCLSDFEPGSLTLYCQGRIEREFSSVFEGPEGTLRQVFSLESRFGSLFTTS